MMYVGPNSNTSRTKFRANWKLNGFPISINREAVCPRPPWDLPSVELHTWLEEALLMLRV